MKISGADLPVEIDGGDATQTVLILRDVNGNVIFELKGDGTGTTQVALTPVEVADDANVATVVTALKTLGLFIDPPP